MERLIWVTAAELLRVGPTKPSRMSLLDSCARAASGHAAAAPPRATSNSRRPMVTVIRPSHARCVKGTIARYEHAVLTGRHPRRVGRTPGTGCNRALRDHAEENLTIRMVHPGELCGRPPRFGNLVKFDVDDRIGEYQRL